MIKPNEKNTQSDGIMAVTEEYLKAYNLNHKIIAAAQLAQQSLYDMCMGFKEMRDSKLYKELGYSDFGDYCEQETGFKRSQAYSYIAIAEKLPADFVRSSGQIGVKKLELLTRISEEERTEITASTDIESATVKELEQQIKELKQKNSEQTTENQQLRAKCTLEASRAEHAEKKVKELESRPIETAIEYRDRIPDNYVTIEAMEKAVDNERKFREEAETENIKIKREANKAETELKAEIKRLGEELEQRKNTAVPSDDTEVFKAYFKAAYDGLNRLVEYVREHNTEDFHKKVVGLIDNVKASL